MTPFIERSSRKWRVFGFCGGALLAAASLCFACQERRHDTSEPVPALTFDAGDSGFVPYGRGGSFDVSVRLEFSDLVTEPEVTIETVVPSDPAAPAPVKLTLKAAEASATGVFIGTARLAYLKAGQVTLRIHSSGLVRDEHVEIEVPAFSLNVDEASNTLNLCSNVTGGDVDVSIRSGAFSPDATTAHATLRAVDAAGPQVCDAGEFTIRTTTAFQLASPVQNVAVEGVLTGTDFRFAASSLSGKSIPLVQLALSVDPDGGPQKLPDAGELIGLLVTATTGQPSVPARGLAVSFASLPTAPFLPQVSLTDDAGQARATLLSPGGRAVRVQVTAGSASDAITVSQ